MQAQRQNRLRSTSVSSKPFRYASHYCEILIHIAWLKREHGLSRGYFMRVEKLAEGYSTCKNARPTI